MLLLNAFLLLVGLAVLYFGAEGLVKGASLLALAFGISPLIVGLTVVAFGTSAPEFLVSLMATVNDSEGISVGNIIGSNICNLSLILGAAALVSPMAISAGALRREYPIMLLASGAFYLLAYTDGHIDHWEGAILFAGIVAFVGYNLVRAARLRRNFSDPDAAAAAMEELGAEEIEVDEDEDPRSRKSILKNTGYLLAGLVGLAIGAQLMVDSASTIAAHFGISSFVIGTTIIAFGTSLPELATSVVAAMRNQSDISIGNIFGSNIFNILFIMGSIPMVFGMDVEPRVPIIDFPVMMGVTLLIFPMMRSNYKLGRIEAVVLLAIYVAYTVSLFIWPTLPSTEAVQAASLAF